MTERVFDRKLYVEGKEERMVLPELLEADGVAWGSTRDQWPVEIVSADGVDELLKRGYLRAAIKQPGIRMAGIVLDADHELDMRWKRIRDAWLRFVPDLPSDGLVHEARPDLRLGVWFMPDNQSPGMLETLLQRLIRASHATLSAYADIATNDSLQHGATFRQDHWDKARTHTLMAWLDPPGAQLHQAVKARLFDPQGAEILPFVQWFRTLFQI